MQMIKPANAGLRMDKPASPLNAMLHINFRAAAPMITPKSHFQFLFQAAARSIKKNKGTARLMAILGAVHAPLRYSISKARNSKTRGSLAAGTGNQNMLVNRANIEADMPAKLFLKANIQWQSSFHLVGLNVVCVHE